MIDCSPGIPFVTVHPNRLNLYTLPDHRRPNLKHDKRFDLSKVSNKHKDTVSDHARRKIGKAVEYLIFMARHKSLPDTFHGKAFKFQIAFITLTLPSAQVHTDNQIKSDCLNQMLIELHRKWHVKHYLWRAEKQINGNIHFHILVDKFVPWSELRDCWNRITNKLGYVDRYRDQMRAFHSGGFKARTELLEKWAYKAQIKAYQAGKANDWNSPNSTDVHSLKQVSNIKDYLIKYCTKNEQNKGLVGRIWGCDYDLSDIKGAQIIADSQVKDAVRQLTAQFNPPTYSGDHFSCITIQFSMLHGADFQCLFKAFSNYLIEKFDFHYQLYQSE
jgi:hypothetical protein